MCVLICSNKRAFNLLVCYSLMAFIMACILGHLINEGAGKGYEWCMEIKDVSSCT